MRTKRIGILLTILISMMTTKAFAYDCCVDGIYYNLNNVKKEASVTYNNEGYSGDVIIPSEIEYDDKTYCVSSIGDQAFQRCGDLTSVTVGNNVTSIGWYAFQRCSNLASVIVGNGVTSIGYDAFGECSNLASVILHCPRIGSWFSHMTSIKEVIIGDNVSSIGGQAFRGCEGLTSITIGNNVTSIEYRAFEGCSNLASVTIPNSVISIEQNVFQDCISLTSITFGNKITQISHELCKGCVNLTSVFIPNSVTHIHEDSFSCCYRLKSFIIEDGNVPINVCGSIYSDVAASMSYVYIGRSIINDRTGAWGHPWSGIGNFDSSTTIVIGQNVSELNEGLFNNDSLTITSYAQNPPILHDDVSRNFVLIVPKGRTVQYATSQYWNKIADKIYAEEQDIKYFPILLNESETNIVALNGFTESIEVEENTQIVVSPTKPIERCFLFMRNGRDYVDELRKNGVLSFVVSSRFKENAIQTLSFTPTEVTVHVGGTLINEVGIENLESIKFLKIKGDVNGTDILTIRKMTNLSLLDMKDANIIDGGQSYYQQYVTSANTIGSYFFMANTNLTKIVLPNTITKIGYDAFRGMTNLCSIAIPKNVVEIGRDAFSGCSGLKSFYIEDSEEPLHFADQWMVNYDGYQNIEYLYLGRNVESSFIAPFCYMYELNQLIIGEQVTTIHDEEFMECIKLERLYIPDGVTHIGRKAFYGCKALKWVYLPSSLKTINSVAFLDCVHLKEVHISDLSSWCNIGFANSTSNPLYYAHHIFVNGIEVTELTDSYNIERINNYSFYGCNGLNRIYIENSTKSIGISAFESCNGISSAYIGNCLMSMGNSAFRNCLNLSSVRLSDNLNIINHSTFAGCSFLSDVSIGVNTTRLDDDAFRDCKSLVSIVIPNSVKEIRADAFSGCINIEDLTLGANVEKMKDRVFYNCDNLKTIYSYSTVPPEITISTFSEKNYQNAVLYVPKGSKTLYWLHPYWEKFFNMEEFEPMEVEHIMTDKNEDIADSYVYNLNGQRMPVKADNINSLPRGIYIVNGKKVIVK